MFIDREKCPALRYVLCFILLLFTIRFIATRDSQKVLLYIPFVEENLSYLDQTDPQLIQYVRARHLSPPSKLPYKLKENGYYNDTTIGWVQTFFRDKRAGVFIEAGAFDGEHFSHTLYLEKELGWNGLLVECNPTLFTKAKSLHRKAWLSNACLSLTSNAGIQNFAYPAFGGDILGTLKRLPEIEKQRNYPRIWVNVDVDTVPLYTLIAALGWKEIDYFSFDIEGSELAVLRTFPFDKVIFKVIVIETQFYKKDEIAEVNSLMKSNGYHFIKSLGDYNDFIYVHDSVKHLVKDLRETI